MATDPFQKHGIDHLSPSNLRLFRDAPAVWIAKYMMQVPDEMGPGAWRGKAVEAGVDRLLYGYQPDDALQAMHHQWDLDAQGVIDPDAEKEFNALPDFLVQAGVAFQGQPIPLQRQAKMSLTLPGISIPMIGYADWLWPDCGTDLKTSWRMPNNGVADPAHVEQVACYSMFHGVPFDLVYVTPKRWTRFEVTPTEAAEAYDRVIELAHAVRSFLAHVENAHDALSMFAPDYTSYFYRPAMTEAIKSAKAVRSLRASQ